MRLLLLYLLFVGSLGQSIPELVQQEIDRCGLMQDAHLHLATWFSEAGPLLAEMTASGIEHGIILSVYGPSNPFGTDPNEDVDAIVQGSGGRIYGLASLNTTGDWEAERETELERLALYLEKPGFVGTKVAPPHTCLPLNSSILEEMINVTDSSSHPVVGIHVGTTPFCGTFGDIILGKRGCCGPEYVDTLYLEPFIEKYPETTFVLMHSGQDFATPDDPFVPFYNGTIVDNSIQVASKYDNVYLEISANLKRDQETFEYEDPLAFENLLKIVDAGLQTRTVYGSDRNQFPGQLATYLNDTIASLIEAGLTEEERCIVMVENPLLVYGIEGSSSPAPSTEEPGTGEEPSSAPTSAAGQAPTTTIQMLIMPIMLMVTWMASGMN